MEPKQISSSVIARLMGFGKLRQPFRAVLKEQKLSSVSCQSKVANVGVWDDKYSSKKDIDEVRDVTISEACDRAKQLQGLVLERNKRSSSKFVVATPAKELLHAYLQRPNSFASKHIIDARATPPHRHKTGMKLTDFSVYVKTGNNCKFGRRLDHRNLESKTKSKHHKSVDPLKSKFKMKENSLRSSFSGEMGPNSTFIASRDSMLSPGQICCETPATETQLKPISAPSFIKKDENYDPECPTSSEESYQPSPVSILEPIFDEVSEHRREIPHLNSQCLEQQLETLESESMDTYSEGSGMAVSSDEETDRESVLDSKAKDSKKREAVVESIRAQESRELAYIDTILTEAGFRESRLVSFDLPIDTIIFAKLEKKYCKQPSWNRSEGRLLFDRINSCLVDIQKSTRHPLTRKKPASRRRLSIMPNMQGLKDELQKLLATQKKQAKIECSAKALAVIDYWWLELKEDTKSVVQELETTIVNELMVEAVGLQIGLYVAE